MTEFSPEKLEISKKNVSVMEPHAVKASTQVWRKCYI